MRKNNVFRPLLWGTGFILAVSLALSALAAVLMEGGLLPQKTEIPAWVITGIASMVGGMAAARASEKLKLPMAAGSAGIYLMVVFVLRGVLFGTVSEKPWLIVILSLVGALAGGIISAGRKSRSGSTSQRRTSNLRRRIGI